MSEPTSAAALKSGPTSDMTGLLDRLRVLADTAGRPDLCDRLVRSRARVLDPSLRIVVTGQVGQGMTTLVRALDLPAGVTLVDVPGSPGADSVAAATALNELASADAVLFVSDASQEYTEPEIALLRQVTQLCPTVVGVITKIDLYHRWPDIQRADRTHLTNAGLDIPLLPVSAALAGTARVRNDAELAQESGIPQLTAFLRAKIVDEADQVLRAAVVNDVRMVTEHLAMADNAQLDALRDPAAGAELERRLRDARDAADRLSARSANWLLVLGDGITELAVDVEHDLRHRLRQVVREADADIMGSDPVKRWAEFGEWLDGQVVDAVRENCLLAHRRAEELSAQVAERFEGEGRVLRPKLRVARTDDALRPVQELEEVDGDRAGVVQRTINSMRGSYGGVLMVGLMTSLAGLALVNPWSIGAGVLLGANTFREDRKARTAQRQAEAKAGVARLMDDVIFQVGRESKYRVREVHRTLRDHFGAVAVELARSADDALRAAQQANQGHLEDRSVRVERVQDRLAELRRLRTLAGRLDGSATGAGAGHVAPVEDRARFDAIGVAVR
jgi:signal recognition particle receptor subunit beta